MPALTGPLFRRDLARRAVKQLVDGIKSLRISCSSRGGGPRQHSSRRSKNSHPTDQRAQVMVKDKNLLEEVTRNRSRKVPRLELIWLRGESHA
jgi:hypothetical protein